jgi:hypothetical protein
MAKKPKGFSEILLQEQWANASDRSFDRLKKKVDRSYGKDVKLIVNQGEIVKMSEVLEHFVDPYSDDRLDKHGLEMLFSMGIMAWNIAMMPKETRVEMIEEALSSIIPTSDADDIAFTKDLIEQMIDRKDKFFADNQRMIVNFELQYVSRGEYHISVASTMPESD